MPREIVMRHRLQQFDHLFGSDAYSAGYYSYLWSDVMAADAWQAFVEAGSPWDKALTERLKQIADKETNGRVIDARDWLSDDSFADGHHMLYTAAPIYTERLTKELIVPALK